MPGAGSNPLARWVDDSVDRVAVGTSGWLLAIVFAIGFPLAIGIASALLQVRYPWQEYGVFAVLGLTAGAGLHLVARERERNSAPAPTRAREVEPGTGPECPECGAVMRPQSNGSDGTVYWGCGDAPACRFTAESAPSSRELVVCQRGHPMVRRVSGRGTPYWECSTFPHCRRRRLLVEEPIRVR